MGIEVSGSYPKIFRNSIQKVHGSGVGESVGISITDNAIGALVFGNSVKSDIAPGNQFGAGATIGIWCGGDSDVTVSHNALDTWDYGVAFSSVPTGLVSKCTFANCATNVYDSGLDIVIEL